MTKNRQTCLKGRQNQTIEKLSADFRENTNLWTMSSMCYLRGIKKPRHHDRQRGCHTIKNIKSELELVADCNHKEIATLAIFTMFVHLGYADVVTGIKDEVIVLTRDTDRN